MTPETEGKNTEVPRGNDFFEDKNFSKKQRTRALLLVTFLGILAFSVGVYQFFATLHAPFRIQEQAETNALATASEEQQQLIEGLRNKDTDQDGISDYDELYVYRTSPYLADSDSDKISDNDEIAANKDPNCPEGKDCLEPSTPTANTNETTNVSTGTTPSAENVPLDTLRQALRDAGAPEDVLNNLSDEELLQMYNEVVGEEATNTNQGDVTTNANQNVNAGAQTTEETISVETLQNLTPSEIREFLKQNGIDEATLSTMSDAELQAIFQEALSQYNQ